MRKRTLVSALLVAGLGFALAGCGSQSGTAAAANNPATASGTLRVMIPSFPVSNDGKAAFQKVVDDFHKKWPKITVEPDFVTYANMNEKVSTSIASGSGYDVLVTGVGWIQPLAAKNVFKPLSDVGVTKQEVTDQSVGALVPALTYKGKIYGYPITADARAVALRKSAFVEAGLDPSKPPRTMAELKQDAEKLTKKDANGTITRSGFDFRAGPGGYRQDFVWLLASTGTPLYTADGKPNFANSKGEQTLDWMKSMVNNVEAYGKQNAAQTPLVYTGEAAMGFTSGAVDCSATGIGQANCDDLEYFLLDNGKPSMFVGGNLASIGSTTKNPQAAWDFIKALTSPDAASDQARLNLQIPASKDAAKSAIVRTNPLSEYVSSHLSDAIYEGGAQNWLEVRSSFNTGIDEALLGKRPAKDVLQELAAQSK